MPVSSEGQRLTSRTHTRRAGPRLSQHQQQLVLAGAFLAPSVVLLLLFMARPALEAVMLSLKSWDGLRPAQWIGLRNYVALFHDRIFWLALRNTALITLVTTLFQVTVPLLIASVLASRIRGSTVFRTLYFMPFVISGAITGVLWGMMLEPNFGILNEALRTFGLGYFSQRWLASRTTVVPSVIVVVLWQTLGFYVTVFFAGLRNISKELYESATLDGANPWQQFRFVTIPMMRPVITVAAVLNTIAGIQLFDQVWIMTAGGPNHASETLGTYLYGTVFGSRASSGAQFGYGAAIACVIMLLSVCVSVLLIRLGRRAEPEH